MIREGERVKCIKRYSDIEEGDLGIAWDSSDVAFIIFDKFPERMYIMQEDIDIKLV